MLLNENEFVFVYVFLRNLHVSSFMCTNFYSASLASLSVSFSCCHLRASKMAANDIQGYELLCKLNLLDLIPVEKYRSTLTGLTVCVANVEGPLVNGYFCLGKILKVGV